MQTAVAADQIIGRKSAETQPAAPHTPTPRGSLADNPVVAAVQKDTAPLWDPYPHYDEHPCDTNAQCSPGLKCEEATFNIETKFACRTDKDCPTKTLGFGNLTMGTVPHCWGNLCTYRPEKWRWCWHRRQPWDGPIVSERKCERDWECPSGQKCGVKRGSKTPAGQCTFLPLFVWPLGVPLNGGLFGLGQDWPHPPPPPKELPRTWDVAVRPLPHRRATFG
jgi:hypothetical protein